MPTRQQKHRIESQRTSADEQAKIAEIRRRMYEAHARGMTWEEAGKWASSEEAQAESKEPPPLKAKKAAPVPEEPPLKAPPKKSVFARQVDAPPKETPDDLTQIRGLGANVAKKLNDAGINSFSQIANWRTAQAEHYDKQLGLRGRIIREDWVGQAKVLAAGVFVKGAEI